MKLYKNLIIIGAIILVLAGAFCAVYFMMPNEEVPQVEEKKETETISVFSCDSDSISKITVKTQDEEYEISKSGKDWQITGENGLNISKSKIQSLVYTVSSVSATKIISENPADAEKFGFDDTSSVVTIYTNDGNQKSIIIGDATLDKENAYIKLGDADTIYLKSASGVKKLAPEYKSFISMELLSIDLNDLSLLSHVYLDKKGNTTIKLEYTKTDGTSSAWRMLSPVYSAVNGQVLSDNILAEIAEFKATEIVEAHPGNLSVYGFDAPYAEFSVGYDGKTTKLIFGDEYSNFRFVKIAEFDTVYMIKTSAAGFLETPYQNLMSRLIHVEYLDKISKVEIINKTEKILLESNGDNYRINGKETEKSAFSKAYQAIIGISLDSVDLTNSVTGDPEVTIKYTKLDGTVVNVEFVPVSDRNYRALINGKGNAITAKKNVNEAIEYVLNSVK